MALKVVKENICITNSRDPDIKVVKENICIINSRNLDNLVNFIPFENSEVVSENVENTG